MRLVSLLLKDSDLNRLEHLCDDVAEVLSGAGITSFNGPLQPLVDKVGNKYLRQFWIRLRRDAGLHAYKAALQSAVDALLAKYPSSCEIVIDVDPS